MRVRWVLVFCRVYCLLNPESGLAALFEQIDHQAADLAEVVGCGEGAEVARTHVCDVGVLLGAADGLAVLLGDLIKLLQLLSKGVVTGCLDGGVEIGCELGGHAGAAGRRLQALNTTLAAEGLVGLL